MQENREWSWVDKDGVEHPVDEGELTFSLSSEALAVHTLVTRSGWGEWLPAFQVAELSWALPPGYADTPRKPELSPAGTRTAPPLDRYPEFEARANDIHAGLIHPALESASNLSGTTARVEERVPFLTIADDDVEDLTVQFGASRIERALEALGSGPLSPPRAEIPSSPGVAATTEPRPSPPSRPGASPPSSRPRPPISRGPTPSTRVGGNSPIAAGAPLAQSRNPAPPISQPLEPPGFAEPADPPRNRARLVTLTFCALAGATGLAYAFFLQPPSTSAPPQAIESSTYLTTASVGPVCTVSAGPERIAEYAQPGLRPTLAVASNPRRIKVGFAKTSRQAMGQELDLENLNVYDPFTDTGTSPLSSVTPFTHPGNPAYGVSRAATTLQSQIFLDARTPLPFGLNKQGLATKTGDIDRQLWPSKFENISVPIATTLSNGNIVLAFRSGGDRGQLTLGVVTPQGIPQGDLTVVRVDAERLGVPSVTHVDSRILVAFDATLQQVGGSSTGNLFIAVSTAPALPDDAKRLALEDPAPTAPFALGLPNGHVLVQWTSGPLGAQRIVAQVFDSKLTAISPSIAVSPTAKDAHSGVTALSGDRALTVYMVRSGENHELWATSLSCR